MGNHMPYEITQCYLPPGRGDFPAFTPAEAGTRFSDPGGCAGKTVRSLENACQILLFIVVLSCLFSTVTCVLSLLHVL